MLPYSCEFLFIWKGTELLHAAGAAAALGGTGAICHCHRGALRCPGPVAFPALLRRLQADKASPSASARAGKDIESLP